MFGFKKRHAEIVGEFERLRDRIKQLERLIRLLNQFDVEDKVGDPSIHFER